MEYYGIKTPKNEEGESHIGYITNDSFSSWRAFFSYPDQNGACHGHKLPLGEAIRAYEAIGYKCAEVAITEIPRKED